MPITKTYKNPFQITGVILILLCGFSFAAAQNFSKDRFNQPIEPQLEEQLESKEAIPAAQPFFLPAKKELTELQQNARAYRQQGLAYQDAGNQESALTFYQKAVELDPWYAVAYNDLGIIFEAKGDSARAEANYLQAIKIDPEFLSPYSNLAVLCERKRDLKNALIYWKKRASMGASEDEWTQKARQRAKDIELVLGGTVQSDGQQKIVKEIDIAGLSADVKAKRSAAVVQSPVALVEKKDKSSWLKFFSCDNEKSQAKKMLRKAKASRKKGNYDLALKQGIDAKTLDPDNPEIQEFLDQTLTRVLAK